MRLYVTECNCCNLATSPRSASCFPYSCTVRSGALALCSFCSTKLSSYKTSVSLLQTRKNTPYLLRDSFDGLFAQINVFFLLARLHDLLAFRSLEHAVLVLERFEARLDRGQLHLEPLGLALDLFRFLAKVHLEHLQLHVKVSTLQVPLASELPLWARGADDAGNSPCPTNIRSTPAVIAPFLTLIFCT